MQLNGAAEGEGEQTSNGKWRMENGEWQWEKLRPEAVARVATMGLRHWVSRSSRPQH